MHQQTGFYLAGKFPHGKPKVCNIVKSMKQSFTDVLQNSCS